MSTHDGMPRRPTRTARIAREDMPTTTTRPEFGLALGKPSTTLSHRAIGALTRTVAALHAPGARPLVRVGYRTGRTCPPAGAVYLFGDTAPAALEAIARHEAGEDVDVEIAQGLRPPIRVWSAAEHGERGICLRFGRGDGSPPVPIHGRELRALVFALRAVVALCAREAA
jgi:hypothetical protein